MKGALPPSEKRDQRAHPRLESQLRVVVSDADNRVEGTIHFDTHDLSVGGAFLRSDLLFEVGEELHVTFDLPGGAPAPDVTTVRARGRVVRVVHEPGPERVAGMGIAFTQLSDPDREAVRAYLQTRARP